MTYESIAVSIENGIARITLNRPDRLNSFTRAMHGELRDALANLGDARVVILTGAGRGFCAGQDLNDRAVAPGEAVDLGETVEESWNPLIRTLAALPQPVIARVNGVAAGAGANIALACDLVIAGEVGQVHPELFRAGPHPRQRRQLAPAAAGRTGACARPSAHRRAAPRRQGRRMGPDLEGGRRRAARCRSRCASRPSLPRLPPLGLAAIKQIIRSSWSRSLDEELDLQRDEMRRLGFTQDYREGVAAFLEKRPADFRRTLIRPRRARRIWRGRYCRPTRCRRSAPRPLDR